jgi:hypothetical protein
MQGVGQAGRPAEIKGLAHHQGEARIDVGAKGLGQREAENLAAGRAARCSIQRFHRRTRPGHRAG